MWDCASEIYLGGSEEAHPKSSLWFTSYFFMADASTSDVASVAAGEEQELQAALALSLTSVDAPSLVERVRDDADNAVY